MDKNSYLSRIDYLKEVVVSDEVLMQLHQHHVLSIPFENLDIHYKRPFDLELGNLYNKVVLHRRGGFCYELNALFNALLRDLGFKSNIISARIFDSSGNLGPEFDHMSIYIETKKQYLADVGFGDLFITPLEIRPGIQSDGRNFFNMELAGPEAYVLSMSPDRINFTDKYIFSLNKVQLSDFNALCTDKQTNPSSYFVKNTVCTKPTPDGRLTIFNDKLIKTKKNTKTIQDIHTDLELRHVLETCFGISL